MSQMTINRLSMSNFKGVKSLEVRFAQDRTDIFGANATGKTTLVDAFCWVLWNKDSNDNAPGSDAFHEKPLDADGHEVHYLDTEVELDCTLDGKPFVLKRVQREHWEKKRGFADEIYKGNESTYWINGIETKSTDFKTRIASIVPADVFKLIGKLGAFNALKWQDRRAALIKLSDGDVDNELLAQAGYRNLDAKLKETGYNIDEYRQYLTDTRKRINDTLKMIPVRIDEAKKALSTLTAEEVKDAQYIADEAVSDIDSVMNMIAALRNDANRVQIINLEAQANVIKRRMDEDLKRARETAQNKIADEEAVLQRLRAYADDISRKMADAMTNRGRWEKERDALRTEFARVKAMPTEVEEFCPTCGKPLDADRIELARAKVINTRKEQMENIRGNGKLAAERVEEYSQMVGQYGKETIEAAEKIKTQEVKVAAAKAAAMGVPATVDYQSNDELNHILSEIDALHGDRNRDNEDKIKGLEERINDLKVTRDRALAKVAAYNATEAGNARIAELEEQRKAEGANLNEVEKMLNLVEGFIRDRCASLEESINRRFDNVRWKLFNVQINGGLADCCVCMIPCSAGLVSYECANTAAQINADIEIVRNLSEYYDVRLPLFVDNCERINNVASAGTQMITLSVSTDKELKVEG